MLNFFKRICYKLYGTAVSYEYHLKVEHCKNTCTLNKTSVVDIQGSIHNNLGKDAVIIGNETVIRGNLMTFGHGGYISIGDNSFVGPGTRIWSAKKIVIGNRVLIAHDVNIHDNNSHPLEAHLRHLDQMHLMTKGFQNKNDLNEREIVIEDDAWIGFNATILKGVKIGKGAIIGANTVVFEDVPDYAVVVGNPPQIIRYTT